MAIRRISHRAASPLDPVRVIKAVTPDDNADLPDGITRGLFVGAPGSVVLADIDGNIVTLASGASQYHPMAVSRVLAAGTTAGGILALY